MNYQFGKEYKLCSEVTIESLFKEGKQIKKYPFVIRYIETKKENTPPFQIVVSAPKRVFRKAHERNRIKRVCKEVIRMNKHTLESYLQKSNKQLALFFIYSSKEEMKRELLDKKINQLFSKLINQLDHDQQPA